MTILAHLEQWKESGAITNVQFDAISALVRKDRFSVFVELNALLYVGVLSFVAGVAWVIQTYLSTMGDAAILSGLSLLLFLSFFYCFSRALPYSPGVVESPSLAFDYVLYLGCLLFAVELAYLETRFQLMQSDWDYYVLFSSGLFLGLAYRFDNRFVLSLALSTLAGWFGLRISRFAFSYGESLRPYALVYGVLVAGIGIWLHHRSIKKHFTETYLHIASNVLFAALISGIIARDSVWLYLMGLMGLAGIAMVEGVRLRRFAFVAYGILYAYLGITVRLLRDVRIESAAALSYLIISGSLVTFSMVLLARRFGREE
jgi:hypothetical protein